MRRDKRDLQGDRLVPLQPQAGGASPLLGPRGATPWNVSLKSYPLAEDMVLGDLGHLKTSNDGLVDESTDTYSLVRVEAHLDNLTAIGTADQEIAIGQ